jgi:hypothetical protein
MALRAVPDHPKFYRLKTILHLNRGCALGYLEGVWHFCARFTPQGNIGKYSDEEIEAWLEWDGEAGALVRALQEAKWLDENPECRLIVHDWTEYADESVHTELARRCLPFIDGRAPKSGRLNKDERERYNGWLSEQGSEPRRPGRPAETQPKPSGKPDEISRNPAVNQTKSAEKPKPVPVPVPEPVPEPEPAAAAIVTIVEQSVTEPTEAAADREVLASFPESRRLIEREFPGTDSAMVARIVQTACRGKPGATDRDVFALLIRTHKGKEQRSAALWLKTIPAYLAAEQDVSDRPPPVCPECGGYGKILGPEFNGLPNDAWIDLPETRTHVACPRCRGDTLRKPAEAEVAELARARGA